MKILSHYALDMNQKTKISTKFPRSKLGVATVVLSLGGVAVYSLGVINPLQASQSEYLQVDGVQNSVQYLTSLVIDSPTATKVEFKYDDASKAVRASGSLNMQNLVVGQGNESSASSVVFWWTKNNNQWANSVIVWGNNTTNEGNNNVIILSPYSTSSSENTAILNGQNVVTNGKNITVVNGGNLDVREKSKVSGNYVTVFGDSSVDADHVVVFGDKVNNNKSNTFVFNGQDTEFVPEQESAFYANSKVAINGDHANATLDVHGGMMIGKRGDYSVPRDWDSSGIISLFSRENKTGLCGYDGKADRRVPLSESARKFWLCAPMWNIWDLPEYAVSNNPQRSFPQVWNQNKGHREWESQNKGHWEWESPKWIYGSKEDPQHFLCADGYVPDNADPIGKTGVKCIACEWAKSGDLNCPTQKGDNSAATPHCPQGTNYNETSKKCERVTICTVEPGQQGKYDPNKTIEVYREGKWEVAQKCQLTCPAGYEKKVDPSSKKESCELVGEKGCKADIQPYPVILDNATLVPWDDQWLTENTPITLIDSVYGVYNGEYDKDTGLFQGSWTGGQTSPKFNSSKKCEYRCKDWYKPVLIDKGNKTVNQCVKWNFDFVKSKRLDYAWTKIARYNPEYDKAALYAGYSFSFPDVSYDNTTKINEIGSYSFGKCTRDHTVCQDKPDFWVQEMNVINWKVPWYLRIPASIKRIGTNAFYNQKFTRLLIVGDNLEEIWEGAFQWLGLQKIVKKTPSDGREDKIRNDKPYNELPTSLTTIADGAFADNKLSGHLDLKEYRGKKFTTIGKSAFENNKISSVSFSRYIDTIWARAFANNPISKIDFSQEQRNDCLNRVMLRNSGPKDGWSSFSLMDNAENFNELKQVGCWPKEIGSEAFLNYKGSALKLPWNISFGNASIVSSYIWSSAFGTGWVRAIYPRVRVPLDYIKKNKRFDEDLNKSWWCSPLFNDWYIACQVSDKGLSNTKDFLMQIGIGQML